MRHTKHFFFYSILSFIILSCGNENAVKLGKANDSITFGDNLNDTAQILRACFQTAFEKRNIENRTYLEQVSQDTVVILSDNYFLTKYFPLKCGTKILIFFSPTQFEKIVEKNDKVSENGRCLFLSSFKKDSIGIYHPFIENNEIVFTTYSKSKRDSVGYSLSPGFGWRLILNVKKANDNSYLCGIQHFDVSL